MRRFLFFIFIATALSASAQNDIQFNPQDLGISWEAVKNDYQNKPGESLNALVLTNNGHTTLPASGWKLYFNSARDINPTTVTGNATIEHLNGDLFTLTPTVTFTALKPGDTARIEFTGDEVINFTDAPEGFYMVWDAEPSKGYSTAPLVIRPFSPKYAGLVTPEVIYNENKVIADIPEQQLTKVFPTPVSYKETEGYFNLNYNKIKITADGKFINEYNLLNDDLRRLSANTRIRGPITNSIAIKFKAGLRNEGYELNVKPDAIIINASTPAGAFYGIQSLKMLIPPSAYAHPQKVIQIPCVEVRDEPRFPYRAVELDVARNFETKQQVLKLIDAMALYKLNVLHLHLSDDEGWRLEIPGLPELTQVGSERGHTLDSRNFLPASHGSGPDTGKFPGSGHYTRADYIEILKYANARHIMVVPEIESPGHARAAVKAMDARYRRLMAEGKQAEAEQYLLHDQGDQSDYMSVQDWTDNVIDVSLPSTYTFFNKIINNITAIYAEAGAPLKTIHFGGDEVPAHVWEKSPAYLALKARDTSIQNTSDLWYYFYGKLNDMLKAKGLYLSGWEEMGLRKTMLDGKPYNIPNPDFANANLQTEVWNNTLGGGQEDLAYKLANAGYKVVLSSVTNLYFDMAHHKSFDEPGYYWGAFIDIDKPFSFIPYDYFKNSTVDRNGLPINKDIFIGKQRLTDYGKSNIRGLQGCLWGENIKTPERMEYMMYPSMLALAERAWAPDPQWATETDTAKSRQLYAQAWSEFINVMGKRELPRLDYYNGGYDYRIPNPGVILQDGKYLANDQFPGFVIRYTTNGREPDAKSPIYKDGVTDTGKVLKFRAFNTKGRGSNVSIPVTSN